MRPSARSAPKGGCVHSAGLPSVTTSVWPSRSRLLPLPFSPSQATTFGRPGTTSWISRSNPCWVSQVSTCRATAASVAPASPGRKTLDIRTSARVRSISSTSSTHARARSTAVAPARATENLLVRKGQDDCVEPDDAVFLAGDVEVVPLDLFRRLLEGHDRFQVRHFPESVGALVEAVAARGHLAVADRGA